jgi:hypothetical protein
MSTVSPFADSEIRIQRARQQFDTLQNEIVGWLKGDTHTSIRKRDPQTGDEVMEILAVEPMPSHWPLVACEITHHLRSSLDNAIHHLSIEHTGNPVRGSEFPIYLVEKDFKNNVGRKVGGIDPRFLPFVEQCQPFRNAKPDEAFLWGLHEVANSEKHQQLPLIVTFLGVSKLSVQKFGGLEISDIKYGNPGAFKAGTEIARWRVVKVVNEGSVTVNFNLTRDIFLDVPRPPCLSNYPLTLALDAMGQETALVIKGMKELYESWHGSQEKPLDDFSI